MAFCSTFKACCTVLHGQASIIDCIIVVFNAINQKPKKLRRDYVSGQAKAYDMLLASCYESKQ